MVAHQLSPHHWLWLLDLWIPGQLHHAFWPAWLNTMKTLNQVVSRAPINLNHQELQLKLSINGLYPILSLSWQVPSLRDLQLKFPHMFSRVGHPGLPTRVARCTCHRAPRAPRSWTPSTAPRASWRGKAHPIVPKGADEWSTEKVNGSVAEKVTWHGFCP